MVAGVFAGNISAEATTPTGNTLDEATRGLHRVSPNYFTASQQTNSTPGQATMTEIA